jgi:tRNA(Arg) A34 adenosine deaminase TadA
MYYNHMAFAERVARRFSNEEQHLVAALQIRGGHVVSYGVNGIKYRRDFSYFNCSLHAEVDLVRKSGFNLNGDKICIYRFNRAQASDDCRDSRPCPLCVNLLTQAGAGRLFFKEGDEVVSCRPHELPVLAVDPVLFTQQYIPKFSTDQTRPLNFTGALL